MSGPAIFDGNLDASNSSNPFRNPENVQPDNNQPRQDIDSEYTSLLTFRPHLVMKVNTSEPRDALQLERTCLSFIRFSNMLFFTGVGIFFNFRLQTSSDLSSPTTPPKTLFSTVVAWVLLVLSICVLILSATNYYTTIDRYAKHKIHSYGFNNLVTIICMTFVVLTLIGVSVSLIVLGYLYKQ